MQQSLDNDTEQKYKICRIFNMPLLVTLFVAWFLALLVFFTVMEIKVLLTVLILISILSFTIYCLFLKKQRWVILGENTISYQEAFLIRFSYGRGRRLVWTEFTISRITRIELEQTKLEKKFNMGRIRIKGHTEIHASERDLQKIPDRREHTVRGVLMFSEFCKACHDRFPSEVNGGHDE